MTLISSKQNPRFKTALALLTKRGRDKEKAFLVEGRLEIGAFLCSGLVVSDIFYCSENATEAEQTLATNLEEKSGLRRAMLPAELIDKLSYRKGSGLVVAAKTPRQEQNEGASHSEQGLFLILEEPAKPGNVGAILRSASGFGASGVITVGNTVDRWNPNVIRSSIGSVFSVPLQQYTSWKEFLSARPELKLVGMHPDGTEVSELVFPKSVGVVFGAESKGLSAEAKSKCSRLVRIPMQGVADSLNLSVCVGVVAYAWNCTH